MKLTYKDSGVDTSAGQKQISLIKDMVKSTHRKGIISDIGGFAGLFKPDISQMKEPILVSATDGVGTKLKLAFMTDIHNTIGIDAVAMCVNDILCQGATPLFFLDYLATGKLIPEKMAEVVEGVAEGCKQGMCSLIGGETAEMPDFYAEGEYDLAGFVVGMVDREKIIDGSRIEAGDKLIALPSSGIHSNGYSLVRKVVFEVKEMDVNDKVEGLEKTIGEELLTPTRIYTKPILELVKKHEIKGISHITGGGFYENIPRMLKEGLRAEVNTKDIKLHKIFELLQDWGNIETDEMYKTFNMGIGIVMAVAEDELLAVEATLKELDEDYYIIGDIVEGQRGLDLCHQ